MRYLACIFFIFFYAKICLGQPDTLDGNNRRKVSASWILTTNGYDFFSKTTKVSVEYLNTHMQGIELGARIKLPSWEKTSTISGYSVNTAYRFYLGSPRTQSINGYEYFKEGYFIGPGISITSFKEKDVLFSVYRYGGGSHSATTYLVRYLFDRHVSTYGFHFHAGGLHIIGKYFVLQYSVGFSLNGYLFNRQTNIREPSAFFEHYGNTIDDDEPEDAGRLANSVYFKYFGASLNLCLGYRF